MPLSRDIRRIDSVEVRVLANTGAVLARVDGQREETPLGERPQQAKAVSARAAGAMQKDDGGQCTLEAWAQS